MSETGIPAEWDLTSATCDDGSDPTSIDLGAGETVTCTFTDTKRGHIIVDKVTVGGDDTFTGLTAGAAGGSRSVMENNPPASGWAFASLACFSSLGTSAISTNGRAVTISTLAPGDTVTCTYTNSRPGTIIINKHAQAGNDTFDYTATGSGIPGSFSITTTSSDGSITFGDLAAGPAGGSRTVTEKSTPGWHFISLVCSSALGRSTISTNGKTATISSLGSGDTVTCTFTNRVNEGPPRSTIKIIKDTVPDDPQDFSFSTTGGLTAAIFSLDDDTDPTLSNIQTFNGVAAGIYTVTEILPVAGFRLMSLVCVDPDRGTMTNLAASMVTIDLDAGETVVCTYTNTIPNSIVIVNDTVPNGPQDFSFTTTGGLSPAGFSVDDDGDSTLSNTRVYRNVAPGTYTVTESLPVSGFNLIGLVCADPDNGSSTSLATGRATIDMDAGETIICTYTNSSATASIVIVKDAVPDGPQDFNYITTGGLTPATFTLDDDLDPTRSNTQVYVNLREVNLADVDRIIVAAAAGNDKITLAPTLLVDAVLDGGDGNDTITAAKGNDILLGGAGKDKLLGGGGRDIVIGGLGADTLQGNGVKSKTPVSGDDGDILIAGATAYDGDQAALDRILAEWTSSRSYGDRRQMLMTGGGGLPQLSSSTMVDDAVNESLIGGADLDWFFATPLDKLIDRMLLEAVN